MRSPTLLVLAVCCLFVLVAGWSKEDHEIFRLRDEVEAAEGSGVTFYGTSDPYLTWAHTCCAALRLTFFSKFSNADFLGVKPSAGQDEISKAYRKKSRLLHPDKAAQSILAARVKPTSKSKQKGHKKKVHVTKGPSQAEVKAAVKQANDRFARLGVVSSILRGPARSRYDHFLKNGFPRWRGTGYYYSRFRPGLGSVLVGLFILGGGAAHYGILRLSWRRQRDFVGRYIREARRAAWGDELGIRGIPGVGDSVGSNTSLTPQDDMGMQGLNRRQRRAQEKSSKKGKGGVDGGNASGAESAKKDTGRGGERKKVVAENGKVLIVDASGNVFLVEENENGETEEFLLDVNEIPKPTMRQTILFRLPIWIYGNMTSLFQKKDHLIADSESSEIDSNEETPKARNGQARRVKKGAGGS
ncbi:hypothetical protein GP486_006700 [Trichoglossum hirsutum]|uniref:J domain-containing protein n=1 Tax=Trichoglossum hirsutum TaxID=265104 RepID=A0A9P8ID34_9PEZI|nr:hypothetical protein GP486_006700 [Trichoglossum hirsutum]